MKNKNTPLSVGNEFFPVPISVLLLSALFFVSCADGDHSGKKDIRDPEMAESFSERLTEVDTTILKRSTFYREIISQGKVVSRRKIEVPFSAQGIITKVAVKEGQKVNKGDLLVSLDDFTVKNQLKKLEAQAAQARLNIENRYINLGYDPDRAGEIPEEIRKNTAVENNLPALEVEREQLEYDLDHRRITAPFSGVITELTVAEGAHTSAYDKLCTLTDDQHLSIRFPILESEAEQVRQGMEIRVSPAYQSVESRSGSGIITLMSPTVTEKGMIECEAAPGKGNIPYREGMRVNIHIRDAVNEVLVLPKSAVVDRQNRLVVFTLSPEGRAFWNYVEIAGENSHSYLIRDGLQPGDTVIMTHNFDLAHLEKVKIAK